MLWGVVRITFLGHKHHSDSLPDGQALKLVFFAPCLNTSFFNVNNYDKPKFLFFKTTGACKLESWMRYNLHEPVSESVHCLPLYDWLRKPNNKKSQHFNLLEVNKCVFPVFKATIKQLAYNSSKLTTNWHSPLRVCMLCMPLLWNVTQSDQKCSKRIWSDHLKGILTIKAFNNTSVQNSRQTKTQKTEAETKRDCWLCSDTTCMLQE